jgi:hypothetical protein
VADETTRVDKFLFDRLTGTPALTALIGGASPRVFADRVPQGDVFPAVVHQLQGAVDVRSATGDARIMVSGLWLVKAIVRSDTFADAAPIADELDEALEEASGAAGTDGAVFSCTREAPFRLVEDDDASVTYRHLGALWRIFVQVP